MRYLKYIAGILILVVVFNKSNLNEVWDLFRAANYLLIACNLPVFVAGIALNSYKWNLLIPNYRFVTLFTSNLIAAYYAVFMPGQLATEGLKVYRLKDVKENDITRVTCSVFVDKLIGLIGLLIVGSSGILLSAHKDKLISLAYIFAAMVGMVLLLIFQTPLVIKIFRYFTQSKLVHDWKLVSKIDELLVSAQNSFDEILKNHYSVIPIAILLSVIFQVINIIGNFIVAKAIHIDIAFVDFLWIIALISIALVIPITVGGLGIRELSFVGIFNFLGLPAESALALSIASYGMLLYHSSFGYLVDLIWGVKKN